MRDLVALKAKLLRRLANGEDIRSSDRDEDKAKQALRKENLIEYVGKPRRWALTGMGKVAAKSA